MATQTTTFTKDVQGRYLCNSYFEAEAWRREGGRPFDIIVIGGGTFGAAIAEHLWFRQTQAGGGLRTLVVEAGLFTLPEHVQNTGILGLADPPSPFNLDLSAPSVDAPFRARGTFRTVVARGRMLPSVRPLVRQRTAAGLYGSSRTGSKSQPRTRGTVVHTGYPDPVSPTVAPCRPSARPTPSRRRRVYAAGAGAR